MEKRGWITWYTWKANKVPDKELASSTLGHQRPFEYRRVPRLGLSLLQILEAGQVSKHGEPPRPRWEFSRKREKTMTWESPASVQDSKNYFSKSAYIPQVVSNGTCRVMQGQKSWPSLRQGFLFAYPPVYKRSQVAYIIFWPRDLLTFLWLSSLIIVRKTPFP